MDNETSNRKGCPRPIDPTAKFAAALAALTRCYEEVSAKVAEFGGRIEDNKDAIEKEVLARIAADDELRAAFAALVAEKVLAEENARKAGDEHLQQQINDIAGSEIGDLAEKLAKEIRLREQGDIELGKRVDHEIEVRTEEVENVRADLTVVKRDVARLPEFYTRVDEVEDKTEVLAQSVKEEIEARAREVVRLDTADEALSNRIKAIEDKRTDEALATERSERIASDTAILGKISDAKEELRDYTNSGCQRVHDKLTADLATETYKREQADKGIVNRIGSVHDELVSSLTTERNSRKESDEAIDARLTKEIKDRKDETAAIRESASTKAELAKETKERKEGDSAVRAAIIELDGRLTAEVQNRTTADGAINANVGRVQDALIEKIANERQDRIDSDMALDVRVSELERRTPAGEDELIKEREERIAADAAITERLDVAKGAIDGLDNRLSDEVANRTMEDNKLWDAIGGGIASKGTGDYSSFYVWANDITVPAGRVSAMPEEIRSALEGVYGSRVTTDDINIAQPIEPGAVHKIVFRSISHVTADLDISVDWGDGTKTAVATATEDELSVRRITNSYGVYESQYTLSHEYKTPGKFLVTVYGRDYFNSQTVDGSNLICDVFNSKSHIASFIKNLASTFAYSNRLLFVDAAYVYPLREKSNLSQTFARCPNLYEFISCSHPTASSYTGGVFLNCANLVKHDSPSVGALEHDDTLSNCFSGCKELEMDIAEVFTQKILATKVAIGGMFLGCKKLYGTVPSKFLWEDATVEWTMGISPDGDGSNKSGPFYGCSDEIREQVPLAWGGTNANIVIRPYDAVRVTKTDLSLSEATSAIKLAAVSSEIKAIIDGLTARIKTLEESGSGGKPIAVLTMTCADDGNDYDIRAVNDGDDPTLDISVAASKAPGMPEVVYFYGNDGKKYAVRIVIEDGEPTIDVSRVADIGDSDITTGIKFDCLDDGAVYVLKVVKPVDDEAVISLVPFGA